MNKEKLKADIFEWLFTHHDAYDSPQEWREAFAKFLNEKIDEAYEGLMFEQVDDMYGQLRRDKENFMGIPFECEGCGAVWDLGKGKKPCPVCNHLELDLPTPYPVTVDYSKSLKQMIKAGKYDRVNEDISYKNFKLAGVLSATKDVFLMSYDETMSSEEVEKDLDKKGMRACILPELLALGAQYPELQKEHYIVALGSRWCDPHSLEYVPVLSGLDGNRELRLLLSGSEWSQHARFAAVAK